MQTARVQWVGKERFVGESPSGHMVALDSDRSSNVASVHGNRCGCHTCQEEAKTRVTGGGSFWRTSGGAAGRVGET